MWTNIGKESRNLRKYEQVAKTKITVYSLKLLYWVVHKEPLQLNLVIKFGNENIIIKSEFYETTINPFSFMKCQEFFISGFKSECLR